MPAVLIPSGSRVAFIGVLWMALLPSSRPVNAQSGSQLRGAGAYLDGLGWYNLNTARATSINVDTVIRWKADLRKIQSERRVLDAQKKAEKKLKVEEIKRQLAERERQLRSDPSAADVHSGDALDVLLYDLTDPNISLGVWETMPVALPEGMSVKDVIFEFTPLNASSATSVALGRGVIALSRLDIAGKWPTVMKMPELEAERGQYERTFSRVKEEVIKGELDVKSLQALDASLEALKARVNVVLPAARGYRAEGLRFVEDLKAATRMFDAATVDYSREMLIDTQEHDASTVGELVAFMLKYRLQFASAERHPAARELYSKLYQAMKEQAEKLGVKPPEPGDSTEPPSSANLLVNPSAEEPLVRGKIPGWTEAVAAWGVRPDNPRHGNVYFAAGPSAVAELIQDVDLAKHGREIDDEKLEMAFSGFTRSYKGARSMDQSRYILEFRDGRNQVLSKFDSGQLTSANSWLRTDHKRTLPKGCRTIRVRLVSTRTQGKDNDGYFDDLSLTVAVID